MVQFTSRGLAYPEATDSVQVESRDFEALANTATAAITTAVGEAGAYTDQVKWDRANPLNGGVNFNTLTAPGFRWVNSTTGSTNVPPGSPNGALEIFRSSNELQVIQRFTTTLASDGEVWQRTANLSSGVWSEWRRIDSTGTWGRGNILGGVDFNDYQEPGWYFVSSTTGSTNAPPVSNGALEVFRSSNNLQVIHRFTATLAGNATTYTRAGNLSSGVWSPWTEVGAGSGAGDSSGALRQSMLRDTFAGRRGGTIGTNNLPVVALRFDHWLTPFNAKVLPLLRQHNLPWAQIMNADTWATSGNQGMTPAQLETAAQTSGGEVWNHGGNHLDATSQSAIYDQIVGSLERLTTDLPLLPIEGWAPPGLGEGGYDGHTPANTIERHADTYAGQLVLSHHGVVAGYMPGIYRTLDGANRVGLAHTTIDSSDPAAVSSIINGAVAAGAGLALMLHSNYLDEPGYLTTAQLGTILADIASRRDAGEIMVLTYSGLWLADARTDARHDLLTPAAATTGTYTQSAALNRQPQYAGGTRELVAQVETTAGATMTVTINGHATTHTVPAGGGTIRRFVTLPLGENTVTVSIARTSGTQHSTSDVRLLAA